MFRVRKHMLFRDFKAQVAAELGIPAASQRWWTWCQRQNGSYRPSATLSEVPCFTLTLLSKITARVCSWTLAAEASPRCCPLHLRLAASCVKMPWHLRIEGLLGWEEPLYVDGGSSH